TKVPRLPDPISPTVILLFWALPRKAAKGTTAAAAKMDRRGRWGFGFVIEIFSSAHFSRGTQQRLLPQQFMIVGQLEWWSAFQCSREFLEVADESGLRTQLDLLPSGFVRAARSAHRNTKLGRRRLGIHQDASLRTKNLEGTMIAGARHARGW